jgi:hypothetical protein
MAQPRRARLVTRGPVAGLAHLGIPHAPRTSRSAGIGSRYGIAQWLHLPLQPPVVRKRQRLLPAARDLLRHGMRRLPGELFARRLRGGPDAGLLRSYDDFAGRHPSRGNHGSATAAPSDNDAAVVSAAPPGPSAPVPADSLLALSLSRFARRISGVPRGCVSRGQTARGPHG